MLKVRTIAKPELHSKVSKKKTVKSLLLLVFFLMVPVIMPIIVVRFRLLVQLCRRRNTVLTKLIYEKELMTR